MWKIMKIELFDLFLKKGVKNCTFLNWNFGITTGGVQNGENSFGSFMNMGATLFWILSLGKKSQHPIG